jgi:Ca2+-transporting ATPase
MLGRSEWTVIVAIGVLESIVTLGVFVVTLHARGVVEARTLAFSTLVFAELFRSFAARSPTRVFWEVGALTNIRLLGVVVATALLQWAIHLVPVTRQAFEVTTLSLADWMVVLSVALVPVTLVEVGKLLRRRSILDAASAS